MISSNFAAFSEYMNFNPPMDISSETTTWCRWGHRIRKPMVLLSATLVPTPDTATAARMTPKDPAALVDPTVRRVTAGTNSWRGRFLPVSKVHKREVGPKYYFLYYYIYCIEVRFLPKFKLNSLSELVEVEVYFLSKNNANLYWFQYWFEFEL